MYENNAKASQAGGLVGERETEISRVILKLVQEVNGYEVLTESLLGRLQPILRSVPTPNGSEAKLVEPEFNTKLAQEINNLVCRLQYLNTTLSQTTSRIEL